MVIPARDNDVFDFGNSGNGGDRSYGLKDI